MEINHINTVIGVGSIAAIQELIHENTTFVLKDAKGLMIMRTEPLMVDTHQDPFRISYTILGKRLGASLKLFSMFF